MKNKTEREIKNILETKQTSLKDFQVNKNIWECGKKMSSKFQINNKAERGRSYKKNKERKREF